MKTQLIGTFLVILSLMLAVQAAQHGDAPRYYGKDMLPSRYENIECVVGYTTDLIDDLIAATSEAEYLADYVAT